MMIWGWPVYDCRDSICSMCSTYSGIKLSRNPGFPWTTPGFQSACVETLFLQEAELRIFKIHERDICVTLTKRRRVTDANLKGHSRAWVVHKLAAGAGGGHQPFKYQGCMEGSGGVPKSLPLSYIYISIASRLNFCFVALCRPWINIIYRGEQARCIARYMCVMELNLSSSRVSRSNLNWPLLPWLW